MTNREGKVSGRRPVVATKALYHWSLRICWNFCGTTSVSQLMTLKYSQSKHEENRKPLSIYLHSRNKYLSLPCGLIQFGNRAMDHMIPVQIGVESWNEWRGTTRTVTRASFLL